MSDNLTERLAEIEKRVNSAVSGPWRVETGVAAGGESHLAVTARHAGRDWMPCSVSPMRTRRDVDDDNAEFIARARTDIPFLIAELRKAINEREQWQHCAVDNEKQLRQLTGAKP